MIESVVRWMERAPVAVWRIVFGLYATALTVGTHWPSLRVRGPGGFPVDKVLHVVAFCGFAGLLMLARISPPRDRAFHRRNIMVSTVISLAWAAVDELTQGVGSLDRFAGLDDYLANGAGVMIACLVASLVFARAPRSDSVNTGQGDSHHY